MISSQEDVNILEDRFDRLTIGNLEYNGIPLDYVDFQEGLLLTWIGNWIRFDLILISHLTSIGFEENYW